VWGLDLFGGGAPFTNVSGQWYNQSERRNQMKANEVKAADKLADYLNDGTFSPAVMANYLVTNFPIYTQDRLMELIRYIIQYEAMVFEIEWENGKTSEGLMLADSLVGMVNAKYGAETSITTHNKEREAKYYMDQDSF
jgi:hypothetical protein